MEYDSYFMDGNFNAVRCETELDKLSIFEDILFRCGEDCYTVVYWEDSEDIENGFELIEAENMTLAAAVETAEALVSSNLKVSANVRDKDGDCVFCVNWFSDADN